MGGRRYHRELSAYEEEEQRGETSARCQRGGEGGGKKSGGTGDKSVTGFRQNSDGGGVRRRRRRCCHIFSRSHKEVEAVVEMGTTPPPALRGTTVMDADVSCPVSEIQPSSSLLVVTLQLPITCPDSLTQANRRAQLLW